MSDKPSLYVVEKKEVVILVVLFVLVTVLSFTVGVRYGESVGRKSAQEEESAKEEVGGGAAEKIGGKLGEGTASAGHGDQGADAQDEKAGGHGETKHGDEKSKSTKDEEDRPEVAGRAGSETENALKESVDKNSDEFLLNALKDSAVEPPGGKAQEGAKLPQDVKEVKRARAGTYVIQVGSHPTRSEAESQIRVLKSKKVSAEVLPPVKDRQNEWHRVVIGSFKSKRDAEKEAAQLKARGTIVSFFVWRLP